jgi:hypothetical protein
LKTYYTGTNPELFSLNSGEFPSTGASLTSGQTAEVLLLPPKSELQVEKVYHLSIDIFNGTEFFDEDNELTLRISDPVADEYCGEYQGVPLVKNMGIAFSLEDGRQIRFNK